MHTGISALATLLNYDADMYRAAVGQPSLAAVDRAIVQEWRIEDIATQKALFDVAKALDKMGGQAWGFVVIKTWGYKDAEKARWEEYWKRWKEIMAARLREMGAVGDLEDEEKVAGRLHWVLADHEMMDGRGFDEARNCFAELVEDAENTIPLGLDLDLALMVDKAAVDSLLDDGGEQAFVWGVDGNFGDEDHENEDGELEGDETYYGAGPRDDYPGHFKIAIDVLIPELWHTLSAECVGNLYPGTGKVYRGLAGQVEDENNAKPVREQAGTP